MSAPSQEPRPQPILAVIITLLLCAIAIHSQLTAGTVPDTLLGLLVVLVMFWAGRSVEGLDRWLRR